MTKNDILILLEDEANKPIDKTNDFTNGLSSGKKEAYSHVYFLLTQME